MAYEIIKNAPPPLEGKRSKYPFHDMEVGDAFDAPVGDEKAKRAAWSHGRRHGKEFTVQRQPDGTYRCWRVK